MISQEIANQLYEELLYQHSEAIFDLIDNDEVKNGTEYAIGVAEIFALAKQEIDNFTDKTIHSEELSSYQALYLLDRINKSFVDCISEWHMIDNDEDRNKPDNMIWYIYGMNEAVAYIREVIINKSPLKDKNDDV